MTRTLGGLLAMAAAAIWAGCASPAPNTSGPGAGGGNSRSSSSSGQPAGGSSSGSTGSTSSGGVSGSGSGGSTTGGDAGLASTSSSGEASGSTSGGMNGSSSGGMSGSSSGGGSTSGSGSSSGGSGASGSTSGGGSGSTSSGSASGSSSGSSTSGSCSSAGTSNEFGPCSSSADCVCPFRCVSDPAFPYTACEKACPCNGGDETCNAGSCSFLNPESSSDGGCGPLPGSCSSDGGFTEFQACTQTSDCACPMECLPDDNPLIANNVCEYAASSTQGCPDPATALGSCGNCTFHTCGAGAGTGAACNALQTGDGTCIPAQLYGSLSMSCRQAGSADAGCLPEAQRGQPAALCSVGDYCFDEGPDGGTCAVVCDPDGGSCPGGGKCYPAGAPRLGFCLACNPGGGPEFFACRKDSDCQCDYRCGPGSDGGLQCLVACSDYSACKTFEDCQGGWCQTDACDSYYRPCAAGNAAAGGVGNCFPTPGQGNVIDGGGGGVSGICQLAGTAALGAPCVPQTIPAWATPATEICQPGEACVPPGIGADGGIGDGGDICMQSCDPTGTLGAPPCAAPTTCHPAGQYNPYQGLCF